MHTLTCVSCTEKLNIIQRIKNGINKLEDFNSVTYFPEGNLEIK